MKVLVQHLKKREFLNGRGEWTPSRARANMFDNALDAVRFCIERGVRDARLVAKGEGNGEMYLYPFGGDPAVKAQQKSVRKAVREAKWFKKAAARAADSEAGFDGCEPGEHRRKVPGSKLQEPSSKSGL